MPVSLAIFPIYYYRTAIPHCIASDTDSSGDKQATERLACELCSPYDTATAPTAAVVFLTGTDNFNNQQRASMREIVLSAQNPKRTPFVKNWRRYACHCPTGLFPLMAR
jgi:hypothetical protein